MLLKRTGDVLGVAVLAGFGVLGTLGHCLLRGLASVQATLHRQLALRQGGACRTNLKHRMSKTDVLASLPCSAGMAPTAELEMVLKYGSCHTRSRPLRVKTT